MHASYENLITTIGIYTFALIYLIVEQPKLFVKDSFQFFFLLSFYGCTAWSTYFPRERSKYDTETCIFLEEEKFWDYVYFRVGMPQPLQLDRREVREDKLPDRYKNMKFILPKNNATVENAVMSMEYHTGVSYGFCHSDLQPTSILKIESDTITIGKMLSILRKDFGITYKAHGRYLMFRRAKDWKEKNKSRYFEPVQIINPSTPAAL